MRISNLERKKKRKPSGKIEESCLHIVQSLVMGRSPFAHIALLAAFASIGSVCHYQKLVIIH